MYYISQGVIMSEVKNASIPLFKHGGMRAGMVIPLLMGLAFPDLYAADRFVALDNPGAAAPYTN